VSAVVYAKTSAKSAAGSALGAGESRWSAVKLGKANAADKVGITYLRLNKCFKSRLKSVVTTTVFIIHHYIVLITYDYVFRLDKMTGWLCIYCGQRGYGF